MSWLRDFEHFVRQDEPLAPHCWLGIGGAAEYWAEPTCVDELVALIQRAGQEQRPLRLIGRGSNLVINDYGVPGVVLHLSAPSFAQIDVEDQRVRVGGGSTLGPMISACMREGLAGLESLVGIPGTVGAALRGNAGDRSTDIGSFLQEATVITRKGEVITRRRDEIQFAYRESSLDELVILEALFEFDRDDRDELTRRMQKQWIVRRAKEPTRNNRAAQLFKDPPGTTASELIEQAGLRGTTVGGAGLFEPDCNFAIAAPEATSQDVLQLIEIVRDRVQHRTGVELESAIEVW